MGTFGPGHARWALFACAAALAAAGRGGDASDGPSHNLIVVSIDTLRPDHLGLHGYQRPTSPGLDAFATRGVVFETALTPAPWTLPAHASLLTGLYPRRHGVRTHEHELPMGVATLAQHLQQVGYHTASIHNTHHLDGRYGLDRGFEHVDYVRESVDRVKPAEVYLRALEWLAEAPEPFFLLLHTFDVHSDYRSLLHSRLEQLESSRARVPDRALPALDPEQAERLRALGYAP